MSDKKEEKDKKKKVNTNNFKELKKDIQDVSKAKIASERRAGALYLMNRNGVLTWKVRYFVKGKDILYNLGLADLDNKDGKKGLSLRQAKDEYYKLKPLIREGKDLSLFFEQQQQEQERQERRKNKKNISFQDFVIETYLPTAKIKKAEKTYLTQKRHFEIWINPVIGKKSFNEITIQDCFKIRDNLQKAGRTPRTIQHIFQSFHHVWQFALDDELTEKRCPTEGRKFELEPVRNEKTRVLSHAEEQQLLDYFSLINPQIKDMIIISLETGLRAGELFKLEWQDLNMETRKLTVQAHKCKTGKARTLPMSERCFQAISRQQNKTGAYVFLNKNNEPFKATPSTYWKAINQLGLNNGRDSKERLTWHSLRHTFATRLQETTGDIALTQKMMGHSQITTTTRYSHINEHQMSEAIIKLERFNQSHQEKNIIPFKQVNRRGE